MDATWVSSASSKCWITGNGVPTAMLQQKYFSSVATICNVWRSAGAARKIQVEVERVYDPAIARQVAKKTPGRCLRGRWGSIDSVEGILFWGMAVLATVFMRLFYKDAKAESKSKTPVIGIGVDEEEDWQREWKNIGETLPSHFRMCCSKLWSGHLTSARAL